MCHHTSPEANPLSSPILDTIVASVTADYIMSAWQSNNRHNLLWHVSKWQISPRNLKRQFSEGRAVAEPGCEMKTAYKLKDGEIPDLTLGQVGNRHNLYLETSFYSLRALTCGLATVVLQLGLSSLEGTLSLECFLSIPSYIAPNAKFYLFSMWPGIIQGWSNL